MPGVSIRHSVEQPPSDSEAGHRSAAIRTAATEAFPRELDALCHTDAYRAEVVVDGDPLSMGYTAYPTYPVETYRTDEFLICLEGKIYDDRADRRQLRSVAEHLFPRPDTGFVGDWVECTDGEFVLYVLDRTSDALAVLNDALGRLPVYWCRDGHNGLLSREINFLLDGIDSPTFDPMGIAQQLLFGFPLGERTLWREIQRVGPGSLLSVSPSGNVDVETVFEFDFEDQCHDRGLEANASELASLFSEACRVRARSDGPDVVSLSGGHDSRAVAAGFYANDLPFTAATFSRPDGGNQADVRIARRVADAMDVDWMRFDIDPPDGRTLSELLDLKAGMNHLGIAYLLSFFRAIVRRIGPNTVYFTGDGGDKAMPDLRPPRSFSGIDDLVSYLLSKDSLVFPLDDVVALTPVSERELVSAVTRHLESYPETAPAQLYKHFKVYERGVKWLFEGEDRNRCYFWSTSPFYSVPFFEFAMRCPDEQKAGNRLYRAFLDRLWSGATDFEDANYGVAMSSPAYRVVQTARGVLARYPRLEDVVRTLYRNEVRYRYDSNLSRVMAAQLASCDTLEEYLSPRELERVQDDRRSCNRQQIYNLFTITAAIDRVACGDVLSAHPDRQFS